MNIISDLEYFKAKEIVKKYEREYILEIREGNHNQFYFDEEKQQVTCRCGVKAVQLRKNDLFLCSTITAYICKFSK